jgi:hypothetical protein
MLHYTNPSHLIFLPADNEALLSSAPKLLNVLQVNNFRIVFFNFL